MSAASAAMPGPSGEGQLFGHPRGLSVLFMTQMWAEFSFFGLQALLVYYMTKQLGFPQAKSSLIYGAYGAAAFFSPFFGGILADRWLGKTRAVVIGAVLMMAGHFAMAFEPMLYIALLLVALGNGLFIPPLAIQVGALYRDEDPRKATAYSAYYMGINVGGLLAPFLCGTVGELYGWHWGFGLAGIGMAIGLVFYLAGRRYLPPDIRGGPLVNATGEKVPERRHWWIDLAMIVGMVILFRIGYEQSGNVIALWVSDRTDRVVELFGGVSIPATWFQALNPLFIIAATPFLMRFWARRRRAETQAHLIRRMAIGCLFGAGAAAVMMGASAASGPNDAAVSYWWVIGYFVLLTAGELLVIPVGLSLVESLAPARFASTAMGAWYIAKFVGSLAAGVIGAYWGRISPIMFFALAAVCTLAASGLLAMMAARRTTMD